MLEGLFVNIPVGISNFKTALDQVFKVQGLGVALPDCRLDRLHRIFHPIPERNRIRFELILCRSPEQAVADQSVEVQRRIFKQFFHCHFV